MAALASLDVSTDPGRPDVVTVSFSVVPIAGIDAGGDPIALSLELVT